MLRASHWILVKLKTAHSSGRANPTVAHFHVERPLCGIVTVRKGASSIITAKVRDGAEAVGRRVESGSEAVRVGRALRTTSLQTHHCRAPGYPALPNHRQIKDLSLTIGPDAPASMYKV